MGILDGILGNDQATPQDRNNADTIWHGMMGTGLGLMQSSQPQYSVGAPIPPSQPWMGALMGGMQGVQQAQDQRAAQAKAAAENQFKQAEAQRNLAQAQQAQQDARLKGMAINTVFPGQGGGAPGIPAQGGTPQQGGSAPTVASTAEQQARAFELIGLPEAAKTLRSNLDKPPAPYYDNGNLQFHTYTPGDPAYNIAYDVWKNSNGQFIVSNNGDHSNIIANPTYIAAAGQKAAAEHGATLGVEGYPVPGQPVTANGQPVPPQGQPAAPQGQPQATPSSTPPPKAGQPNYRDFLPSVTQSTGAPVNVIHGLVRAESNGQFSGFTGNDPFHKHNSDGTPDENDGIGFTGITLGTGKKLGFTREQLLTPEGNLQAGTAYVASLYPKYGNWFDASMAYRGPDHWDKVLAGKEPMDSVDRNRAAALQRAGITKSTVGLGTATAPQGATPTTVTPPAQPTATSPAGTTPQPVAPQGTTPAATSPAGTITNPETGEVIPLSDRPLPTERSKVELDARQEKIKQARAAQERVQQVQRETEAARQKGETTAGIEMGKDVHKTIIDSAQARDQTIQNLELTNSLLDKGLPTGKVTAATLPVRQWAKSIGILTEKESADLGDQELLQSITNRSAMILRNPASGGGLPGSASDKDVNLLVGSTAGLEKTPQGNRLINTSALAFTKRERALATAVSDYMDQGGTYQKLPQFMSKWRDDHPLLRKFNTPEEANKASLTPGTLVVVGGRLGVYQ